jgi:hypothetical protein
VRGFSGAHVKDYMEASVPQFAVGEYWDSMAYDWEGVLDPNQVRCVGCLSVCLSVCQGLGAQRSPCGGQTDGPPRTAAVLPRVFRAPSLTLLK